MTSVAMPGWDGLAARAAKGLLALQQSDGWWAAPADDFSLPSQYQQRTIKTAHACRALMFCVEQLDDSQLAALQRSVLALVMAPTDDASIDDLALRAIAAAPLDAPYVCTPRDAFLARVGAAYRGGWMNYPVTYHFTTLFAVRSLVDHGTSRDTDHGASHGVDYGTLPKDFVARAFKHPAYDGMGWGVLAADGPTGAQPSTTAAMLLAILLAGGPTLCTDKRVVVCAKWLERAQRPDGGWAASTITEARHGVYHSTALACMALLLVHADPERLSLRRAVQFLMSGQRDDGLWPHTTDDGTVHLFTQSLVLEALRWHDRFSAARTDAVWAGVDDHVIMWHVARSATRELERSYRVAMLSCAAHQGLSGADDARERRAAILALLARAGPLDDAGIIDGLQVLPVYAHLRKKTHLTLIKSDTAMLRELGLIVGLAHRYVVALDYSRVGMRGSL
jgi:hypothetical protein